MISDISALYRCINWLLVADNWPVIKETYITCYGLIKIMFHYSGIELWELQSEIKKNQGIKKREIKLTFRQKRDKENERISRSRGTEGQGKGFQSQREKLLRNKKREVGGLVIRERWKDIETTECQGKESENQRWGAREEKGVQREVVI